jgi:hypothetical protein
MTAVIPSSCSRSQTDAGLFFGPRLGLLRGAGAAVMRAYGSSGSRGIVMQRGLTETTREPGLNAALPCGM